jgi:hypothetical protein
MGAHTHVLLLVSLAAALLLRRPVATSSASSRHSLGQPAKPALPCPSEPTSLCEFVAVVQNYKMKRIFGFEWVGGATVRRGDTVRHQLPPPHHHLGHSALQLAFGRNATQRAVWVDNAAAQVKTLRRDGLSLGFFEKGHPVGSPPLAVAMWETLRVFTGSPIAPRVRVGVKLDDETMSTVQKLRSVRMKSPTPCQGSDKIALLAAFVPSNTQNATAAWARLGWEHSSDPCGADGYGGWDGVICGQTGRIVEIVLAGANPGEEPNGMQGLTFSINGNLGELSQLTQLHLFNTLLFGTIPSEITSLRKLQILYLHQTSISGTIPSQLAALQSAVQIRLHETHVSGTLPRFAGMDMLALLYLHRTLISGTMTDVYNIGKVPSRYGNGLNVASTELSGTIPVNIGNMQYLQEFQLHGTSISGTLPSQLGDLHSLTQLALGSTALSGTLPSLLNLSSLQYIKMGGSLISGTLPAWLAKLSRLGEVALYNMPLSGTLPALIGHLEAAWMLELQFTSISGTLPHSIGMLHSLRQLSMQSTLLSGTLPSSLNELQDLRTLIMANTRISGAVPHLSGCNVLTSVDMGNCALSRLPTALPVTISHLYLNGNPLNATAAQVSQLLATLPKLSATDISMSNSPIILEPLSFAGELHTGTEVATPNDCIIGEPCKFVLYMVDTSNNRIHVGNMITNLTVRLGARVSPMVDNGDGSFKASVPLDWVQHTGRTIFQFFHFSREFRPAITYGGSILDGRDCSSSLSADGMQVIPGQSCSAIRTVNFLPRQCSVRSNTVPDSATGSVCQCKAGFVPYVNESGGLVCHIPCKGEDSVSRDGRDCVCTGTQYDSAAVGDIVCVSDSWSTNVDQMSDSPGKCRPCPTQCATCNQGTVTLLAGWRLNASTPEGIQKLVVNGAGGKRQIVLRCPSGGFESSACPRLDLSPLSPQSSVCLKNHTGILCAVCVPGFSLTHGNLCVPCDANGIIKAHFGLSIGWFVALLTFLAACIVTVCYQQRLRIKRVKREVYTQVKIMLGLLQIIALLKDVLSLVFPPNAQHMLNFAALVSADIHSLINFDCLGWSFFDKWALTVIVIPAFSVIMAGIFSVWQLRSKFETQDSRGSTNGTAAAQESRRRVAKATFANSLFFLVLLLYPQVSNRIFSTLRCRQLGDILSVLEEDYSIGCFDSAYKSARAIALVLVIIWPVGIPVSVFVILWAQRRKSISLWHSVESDDSAAENLDDFHYARLESSATFCVIDSYGAHHFWFEPVDMLRKVALSGLLQFCGRGTSTQVLAGCVLAFASFGLQQRLQPYKEPEANSLKACVDTQIFLTFLLSFMLRAMHGVNTSEPFDTLTCGWLIVISLVFVLSAAVALTAKQMYRKRQFRSRLQVAASDNFGSIALVELTPSIPLDEAQRTS